MVELLSRERHWRPYLAVLVILIAVLLGFLNHQITNEDDAGFFQELSKTNGVHRTVAIDSPEKELVKWFERKGAQVNFYIDTDENGHRGVFASKDFNPGETVFVAPLDACIQLDGNTQAEQAYNLLLQLHQNPTFAAEYWPYFSTLPLPNSTFAAELFTDYQLSLLQSPALEKVIKEYRTLARAVYYGLLGNGKLSLAEALGGEDPLSGSVSLDTFMHLTSLISSRYFGVHSDIPRQVQTPDDALGTPVREFLVPVGDMINYDINQLNVDTSNDGSYLIMLASRPVAQGQQLFWNYLPGLGHRPDMTLMMYGFFFNSNYNTINYTQKKNQVSDGSFLLPAVDLPVYDESNPFAESPSTDTHFYGPGGSHNTLEEYERLSALLAEMLSSTTEEEDVALLLKQNDENASEDSDVSLSWKDRTVIEFRLYRKRALKHALAVMKPELRFM